MLEKLTQWQNYTLEADLDQIVYLNSEQVSGFLQCQKI